MTKLPTHDKPPNVEEEDEEDSAFGRRRLAPTMDRSDEFLDGDDLPNEDDLLTEVLVPEAVRLQRLKEIQEPFKQQGAEPFTSSCYLVAKAFNVPISLVSLVYDEFQWFKAKFGRVDVNSTDRCWSFCAHTLIPERPHVLYVPDALEDDRFRDNYLVHNKPNIRFYCGVPLVTQDGVRLGALCIIDNKPRRMCKDGFQFLINIAELTVREMLQTDVGQKYKPVAAPPGNAGVPTLNAERKFRRIPPAHKMRRLRELWFEKGLTEGVLLLDTSVPKWNVVWTNPQWDSWTEYARVTGRTYPEIWSVLRPVKGETAKQMQTTISDRVASTGSCSFLARVVSRDEKSSVLVSCDVVISSQPIKDVNYNILMPPDGDAVAGPPSAEVISFDGHHLLMVFVKYSRECVESERALTSTSFQDDKAVENTANFECLDSQALDAVESGNDDLLGGIPKPPSSPLRPAGPCPNRNRNFRRISDSQGQ